MTSPGKYLCRCSCGKEINVWSYNLTTGHTKSCGCIRDEFFKSYRNPQWKGGVTKLKVALFDTFAHQLYPMEDIRRDPEDPLKIQVICTKCKKWFTPTRTQVDNRIHGIKGQAQGESRFYCSDHCKDSCEIYGRITHPKGHIKRTIRDIEVPRHLGDMVKQRDENLCQRCESSNNLHAHHIIGASQNPLMASDIDNCITLCKSCHIKVHSQPGCTYKELQCTQRKRL